MAYVQAQAIKHDAPPVIVIGAGGHGKVLIDTLRLMGRQILFVTDDSLTQHGKFLNGAEVRGSDKLLETCNPDEVELVNGVGSVLRPDARKNIFNRFQSRGFRFATVVHPSATIAESVVIAQGAQVMAGVSVQPHTLIGANVILNTCCSVDHDCSIGMHSHLAPGVTLSGSVTIGQMCHIGTRATIIQNLHIGHRALVAAGAVVIRDVASESAVAGVPATPMKQVPSTSGSAGGI